jgi:hypothetical protein
MSRDSDHRRRRATVPDRRIFDDVLNGASGGDPCDVTTAEQMLLGRF